MNPTIRVNVYGPTAGKVARALLSSGAYLIERSGDPHRFFKWKAKIEAPVYCNCRVLFSHPGQRAVVVRSLASAILAGFPEANCIIGLAEAGTVWAACVASELGLPVAYVSKTQKEHGVGGMIVGGIPDGVENDVKAVIVDDLVASGESLDRAIEILALEKRIRPLGIQSIVNWDFQKSRVCFERLNVSISTLVSYPQILQAALEDDLIGLEAASELTRFYLDPWSHVWTAESLACLSQRERRQSQTAC